MKFTYLWCLSFSTNLIVLFFSTRYWFLILAYESFSLNAPHKIYSDTWIIGICPMERFTIECNHIITQLSADERGKRDGRGNVPATGGSSHSPIYAAILYQSKIIFALYLENPHKFWNIKFSLDWENRNFKKSVGNTPCDSIIRMGNKFPYNNGSGYLLSFTE